MLAEICLMKVLVTAATELEIFPFVKKNSGAEIFIHGVGATNTAFALSQKINAAYDIVIQAGIAGSFTGNLQLGQTVAVAKDCFADLGLLHNGTLSSVFEMGLAGENDFPYKNGYLENYHPILQLLSLQKVNAATINLIISEKNYNQLVRQKYNAHLETMEGAAFHYVCLQKKIPFLQIRGISNYVGERDKSKWKMEEAIDNLCNSLEDILKIV